MANRRRDGGGLPIDVNALLSTPPRGRRPRCSTPLKWGHEFLSTPPRGRRPQAAPTRRRPACFYPRLRAGGDCISPPLCPRRECFYPRLRAGGDARSIGSGEHAESFYPRLRAGGDPVVPARARRAARFLSTPPRGRRQASVPARSGQPRVSIHASAREATRRQVEVEHARGFLSTPPRGRRPNSSYQAVNNFVFLSTPPRGRRPQLALRLCSVHLVSIHASAREATSCHHGTRCVRSVSIHASAREATPHLAAQLRLARFRSKPPRGRRRGGGRHRRRDVQFLSTPPRGRRPPSAHAPHCLKKFLSTPPRGRRPSGGSSAGLGMTVSIHASAREAT